jgi:hypothetical protein
MLDNLNFIPSASFPTGGDFSSTTSSSHPLSLTITKGNFNGLSGRSLKNEFITMNLKTYNKWLLYLPISALRSFCNSVGFLLFKELTFDESLSANLCFLANRSFLSYLPLLLNLFWNLSLVNGLLFPSLPCPCFSES